MPPLCKSNSERPRSRRTSGTLPQLRVDASFHRKKGPVSEGHPAILFAAAQAGSGMTNTRSSLTLAADGLFLAGRNKINYDRKNEPNAGASLAAIKADVQEISEERHQAGMVATAGKHLGDDVLLARFDRPEPQRSTRQRLRSSGFVVDARVIWAAPMA